MSRPGPGRVGRNPATSSARPTSDQQQGEGQKGAGGDGEGGFELMLEFRIDDLVEWLWEELKLPNLKMKAGDASATTTMCARAGIVAVPVHGWIGAVR